MPVILTKGNSTVKMSRCRKGEGIGDEHRTYRSRTVRPPLVRPPHWLLGIAAFPLRPGFLDPLLIGREHKSGERLTN